MTNSNINKLQQTDRYASVTAIEMASGEIRVLGMNKVDQDYILLSREQIAQLARLYPLGQCD